MAGSRSVASGGAIPCSSRASSAAPAEQRLAERAVWESPWRITPQAARVVRSWPTSAAHLEERARRLLTGPSGTMASGSRHRRSRLLSRGRGGVVIARSARLSGHDGETGVCSRGMVNAVFHLQVAAPWSATILRYGMGSSRTSRVRLRLRRMGERSPSLAYPVRGACAGRRPPSRRPGRVAHSWAAPASCADGQWPGGGRGFDFSSPNIAAHAPRPPAPPQSSEQPGQDSTSTRAGHAIDINQC